jgi:phage portal protein BeeE
MNLNHTLRAALRHTGRLLSAALAPPSRKTLSMPSLLGTFGPRAQALPKPTPANLRRFAETPVARKAINTIKDRVAGMRWRIQPKNGRALAELPHGAARIRGLTDNFDSPNPDDSFRSLCEQVLEDVIIGGFGAIEIQLTNDAQRPLVLWPVDGATILMRADWDGQPSSPRYVQVAGYATPLTMPALGPGLNPAGALGAPSFVSRSNYRSRDGAEQRVGSGQIELRDDELIYIRLNPRTHTPFGLGRLEVAFETINNFLGAYRHASRLASNSVVQYALWIQSLAPAQHERLIRWWQDEIEGTGRVPLLSVENKPEVLRFGAGNDSDLRIQWQEFMLRMIANAFDLPPFFLGLEHDVNRSTAGELADQAFRSAIVPTARLLAEHFTRDAIAKKLGWQDLEFVFTDVDARNELEEAQIQEILLRNGILTVNEVRAMRGLPPLLNGLPAAIDV